MKGEKGISNQKKTDLQDQVVKGLKKLAFGNSTDVVKMLVAISQNQPPEYNRLNLFNLSEFRKTKDGFEVKLFDRQKAMEALLKLEEKASAEATAYSFYEAFRGGK